MLKQAHIYVKGDVIGIGFRAWTKIQAKTNNITGWVKNVYDRPAIFDPTGGVETVLQGDEQNVNAVLEKFKLGPVGATISDLKIVWENPTKIFDTFEILK